MKRFFNWMMAALLISGATVLTSCSSDNDDNSAIDSLTEKVVGKWIHTDTNGEAVTTDMKSVYTFTKNGTALKGSYSMSMTESGVWAYNQETDVTVSGNTITMTSRLDNGQQSVVELTDVSVSGDDLRFTAKTMLSKDGQVTATYGPRQEHFTKMDADYTEAVVGLWEITFTSDNPEYESSEPYRELYRADGTASFYDLIDGQWVEEETTYSEYFADGPLFCFRWQKPGQEGRRENWEILSCEDGKMVNKAFHRRADGSTYTITAHLKKVEWEVTPSQSRVGYSAWNTQVSYTHCEPLPKTGMPEFVSGTWEVNDGILQHKAYEQAPLAICNYVIPSDHYTIQCTARKDDGPEGFIIVFNYVDAQHYCWLNFGCGGNTQHAIEQTSGAGRTQMAVRPGSVETGKWYDVQLTVAGDTVKAWLDEELMFDEVLKQILEDQDDEERDVDLPGLWRTVNKCNLDAAAVDRSHFRNRLAMDLFNSFSRLPYSTAYEGRHGINGSYVEVWTEGRYSGLYCLTDRVNRKLLGGKKMKGGAKGGALRGIVYKCKSYDKGCYS